jgi:hypothetical protein
METRRQEQFDSVKGARCLHVLMYPYRPFEGNVSGGRGGKVDPCILAGGVGSVAKSPRALAGGLAMWPKAPAFWWAELARRKKRLTSTRLALRQLAALAEGPLNRRWRLDRLHSGHGLRARPGRAEVRFPSWSTSWPLTMT